MSMRKRISSAAAAITLSATVLAIGSAPAGAAGVSSEARERAGVAVSGDPSQWGRSVAGDPSQWITIDKVNEYEGQHR